MPYEFLIAKRYFNSDQRIPFGLYLLATSMMVIFFPITVVTFFWVVTVEPLYARLRRRPIWNAQPVRLLVYMAGALFFLVIVSSPILLLFFVDWRFSMNWFSGFPFLVLPPIWGLFFLFRVIISHVVSGRRYVFASVISFLSVFGIYAGVMALIITLSIMNGFESEVKTRILGFRAHIELRKFHKVGMQNYREIADKVKRFEHIVGISPYVEDKALIVTKNKRKSGVSLKGVDAETISEVSDIPNDVIYGAFELGALETNGQKAYPGIVLGRYLADGLGITLGDQIQILSPAGLSPIPSGLPPIRSFQVTGFFETGIFEIDNVFAYIDIEQAQRLFQMPGQVTGLEIKLDDLEYADAVSEGIDKVLGYPYTTVTWFEMNKNLFSWMQMEKWGAFIILSLIILIAAFNIINTLIMMVMVKTREIGILKSMGATSRSVMKIFMYDGLVGGAIGTMLGCLMGFFFCWAQLKFEFFSLPPDVYIISALPILMKAKDFILITSAALLLSLLATIYPALKAAQLNPVEAIRYE